MPIRSISILLIGFLFTFRLSAQSNPDYSSGVKPIDFSGDVNLSMEAYNTNRVSPRYRPLTYVLNANPVVSVYGFVLPFNFTFSEQARSFRQPFNQFGVSPQWKWLKVHLGYRNVTFSPYTLNGHTFLGAGIEANPGLLRIGAVYGRFLRSIVTGNAALDSTQNIDLAFDRRVLAVKLGLGKEESYFDLIMLKGKDSYNVGVSDSLKASLEPPQENFLLGANTKLSFLKKALVLEGEISASAYTDNTLAKVLSV